MKKSVLSFLVAVISVVVTAWVVAGQAGGVAGLARPLVVDVAQRVPLELELSVPLSGSESVSVTAPITVDVALQITIDGAKVVNVAEAEPARVTVSALAAQGEQLVDRSGYQYAIETPDNIEVIQLRSYIDDYGDFIVVAEIRNVGDEVIDYPSIVVTIYDTDGNIIESNSSTAEINELEPGATTPVDTYVSTLDEDVGGYLVQFD